MPISIKKSKDKKAAEAKSAAAAADEKAKGDAKPKSKDGPSTPPVSMITKNAPYGGEMVTRKEKRQSSSRFNISTNRELTKLPLLKESSQEGKLRGGVILKNAFLLVLRIPPKSSLSN